MILFSLNEVHDIHGDRHHKKKTETLLAALICSALISFDSDAFIA
jgi:hypothetical protein